MRKNIASVKIIKLPTDWASTESMSDFGNITMFPRGFEIVPNDKFVEALNSNPNLSGRPRIGTIINGELKVYPVPRAEDEGEELELYTYLSSSAGVIDDTNEPEIMNMYDRALEYGATAPFLPGETEGYYMQKYQAEIKRLKPIQNRKHHNHSRPPIFGLGN